MADLAGINLAMQTPFDAEGAIDFGEWERLIDAYVGAGVHGLVLGAGTGQHPYLTEAEANRLYEIGIERVGGRCNVTCQTSALNVDEVIRRSRHAEAVGADAIMVLPPYLEGPPDDDGIFEFYRTIDANVDIDIVGYNIPRQRACRSRRACWRACPRSGTTTTSRTAAAISAFTSNTCKPTARCSTARTRPRSTR